MSSQKASLPFGDLAATVQGWYLHNVILFWLGWILPNACKCTSKFRTLFISLRYCLEKVWFLEGSQKEAEIIEMCSFSSWTSSTIHLHSTQAYGNRQGQPSGVCTDEVAGKCTRIKWAWTHAVNWKKGPMIPFHIKNSSWHVFLCDRIREFLFTSDDAEDGRWVKKRWEKHSSVSLHVIWDST